MITVEEKLSEHVPGHTSLYVRFDYKPELVSIVKQFSGSFFSKRDKYWEIPLGYLPEFIEQCCAYDAINIKFSPNEVENEVQYDIIEFDNPDVKLFPHQKEAVNYGLQDNHKQWLLLDTMGLGKTYSAIALANNLKHYKGIRKVLIICGVNALKNNWKKEIQTVSNLPVIILGERPYKRKKSEGKFIIGSIKERIEQLKQPIDAFFVITNIETIRDTGIVKALNDPKSPNKFDMIIFDEIHHCVSASSIQSDNLQLLNCAEYKLGLTGTLLLNSPEDCFVPLKWIGAERCGITNFKYTYVKYENSVPVGFHNMEILKDNLYRHSMRRTKDLLDLPPKTIVNKYIDLEGKHAAFYQNLKDGVLTDVDKVKIKPGSLLALLTRFRQATVMPSILSSSNIPSCKLDYAEDLAKQIMTQGDKVVIFSTYKEPVFELQRRLSKYNPVVGTGDVPDAIIAHNVEVFQTDPSVQCFIGTWQRCGTGITLTAATYMIFLDTAWTNAEYQQNQDRIYRIGTTRPVTIYNIICNGTVVEHVVNVVEGKEVLSDFIVDDKLSNDLFGKLRQYVVDLE